MKHTYKLLTALVLILSGSFGSSYAQTSTFSVPGTYTYTPMGVTSMLVDMQGGRGGKAVGGSVGAGGKGGRVQCTLTVPAGTTLNIVVGGKGTDGIEGAEVPGGYNNTGAVGGWSDSTIFTTFGGGGGGGASEICIGGTTLSDRAIVAGAGGGGGCNYSTNTGGNGGGLTGQNAPKPGPEFDGTGGTQTTFGIGGIYATWGMSLNGAARYGGAASTYPIETPGSCGGGGGGGYYGGGGGSWGGGGGGSSYTNSFFATSVTHTQGYDTTDGSVKLTFTCETPTAGSITGNAPVCANNHSITLANPTGSTYGTWSSSDPGAASVDAATGIVTSGTAGTATITYNIVTSCGTTASATAVVTVNPIPDPGIITGTNDVCPGLTTTLSSSVTGGLWSSSSANATVNAATGVVTGVTTGTATISYTVTSDGCSAIATIPLEVNSSSICSEGVKNIHCSGNALQVYPNPNNGIFTINLSSATDKQAHIMITNMVGEKVKEMMADTNTPTDIQLDMPGGVYFLNVVTANGRWTEKLTVIK